MKIEFEVLKKKVKTLEDEKGELEELCAVKEEEALICEHEIKTRLSNLHAFADKLSVEKEKDKEEISQLKQGLAETKNKLSKSNKLVKTNEKEIHNLTKNLENCHDTIKSLKDDKAILKAEKFKAENDLKKIVKKSTKTVGKKSVETQTDFLVPKHPLAVTSMSSISSSLTSQPSSKSLSNVDEEGNEEPNEKSTCDDFFSGDKPIAEPETDEEAVAVPNIKVRNFFETLARDVTTSGSNSIYTCLNSTTRDSTCLNITTRDSTRLDSNTRASTCHDSTSRDSTCLDNTTKLNMIGLDSTCLVNTNMNSFNRDTTQGNSVQPSRKSLFPPWTCEVCYTDIPWGQTWEQVIHIKKHRDEPKD